MRGCGYELQVGSCSCAKVAATKTSTAGPRGEGAPKRHAFIRTSQSHVQLQHGLSLLPASFGVRTHSSKNFWGEQQKCTHTLPQCAVRSIAELASPRLSRANPSGTTRRLRGSLFPALRCVHVMHCIASHTILPRLGSFSIPQYRSANHAAPVGRYLAARVCTSHALRNRRSLPVAGTSTYPS